MVEPGNWTAEEYTVGPSLWGHDRAWLPEDKRAQARAMRTKLAEDGVRHPVQVIELDVAKRKLHLHVSDSELAARRAAWKPPKAPMSRGYWKLYVEHVNQASEGCDLDFLVGKSGAAVPRDNH